MKASDCFSPGFVIKPHGLKGAVMAKLSVKEPSVYAGLETFFVEKSGHLVPYMVESFSLKGDTAYVKFEGIENSEDAALLRLSKLYLPVEMAPEQSENDPMLTIGYMLTDEIAGDIGKIREVMMAGTQETLVISHEITDVLIPFVPQIVVKIDHKNRVVHTRCPEGLIDMYLGE